MNTFEDLQERAITIKKAYSKIEPKTWGPVEHTMGLVGDVGDLLKIVMAKQGFRNLNNVDASLKHELVDVLWSTMIIAHEYHIDLEQEFIQGMDELEKRINDQVVS